MTRHDRRTICLIAAALWTATILYGIELCFRYGSDPVAEVLMDEIENLHRELDANLVEEERIQQEHSEEMSLVNEMLESLVSKESLPK